MQSLPSADNTMITRSTPRARPESSHVSRLPTLAATFDPRANALNLIRLLLAVFVIIWHAFPLSGADIESGPVRQIVSRISVDGFFAISGFLIVSSWMRHPRWGTFLRARVLRIFPAFWVCLVLTAAIFAPAAVLIRGAAFPDDFAGDALGYVLRNAPLRVAQFDIAGTPEDVPHAAVWNGALWTLAWEFACYVGVLVIGLTGLLRRRVTLPALFVLAVLGVLATAYGPVGSTSAAIACRLGVMFLAGALIYRFQDRIPVSGALIVASVGVVIGAAFLSEYSALGALPIAYLVITLGALGKNPRLRVRNDLSYGIYIYGFPIQQLLATVGVTAWGIPAYALVSIASTLPFAAASWFLIEKPALRFKGISRRPETVQEAAVADRPAQS
jgi:peptidoglycan/LPS O-acetylase OafA/YrhL